MKQMFLYLTIIKDCDSKMGITQTVWFFAQLLKFVMVKS